MVACGGCPSPRPYPGDSVPSKLLVRESRILKNAAMMSPAAPKMTTNGTATGQATITVA